MSVKVLTLFGEEIVPEKVKPEPRKAAAKKAVRKAEAESAIPEQEMVEDGTPEITTTTGESTAEKERKPRAVRTARKEKELKGTDALANFNGDKQYYTIGEVAVLFNVRTSNIRFWTKEFDLKVRTTRKGDRLYTPEQVREINTIYHLVKERGFTIAGARAKLKDNKKAAVNAVDLKKSLTQLRSKLLQIRNKLS